MKAYKMLRTMKTKKGLYPLFVEADKETPLGVWLEATEGERNEKGKVKSKLGGLKYRPGWHCSTIPYVKHIGEKEGNEIKYMRSDVVWVECEVSDTIDYQPQANERGRNKKGIIVPKNADLDYLPKDGYYRYKTNPNMEGEWIICGAIKLVRVVPQDEVREICRQYGYTCMEYR